MKDFRLDRKAEPKYILDVKTDTETTVAEDDSRETTETLRVVFADGRVFNNLEYSEENIKKIIEQQEKQAAAGVGNISVFEKRKTKAGIMTAASIVGGPVIGAVAAGLLPNPFTVAIGAGILTVATAIPAVCSLVKNAGKVSELRKIKYRDDHRKELSTFDQYENSLVGLSSRKRRWFSEMKEEGNDPFCITEIDEFSQSDLEQIIENIDTEKTYKFTYSKRPAAAKK